MVTENDLLEPRKAYEDVLKNEIKESANKYFDDLVAKSGIDVALNQDTIREHNSLCADKNNQAKILNKKKTLSSLLIVVATLMIFIAVVMFVMVVLVRIAEADWVMAVFGVVVPIIIITGAIVMYVMNAKKVKPVIKNQEQIVSRLDAAIQEKKALGEAQMRPLNELYTWNMHVDIINNAIPLLKLDKFFDFQRLQYLIEYFGLSVDFKDNVSIVHVQSGEILGNPGMSLSNPPKDPNFCTCRICASISSNPNLPLIILFAAFFASFSSTSSCTFSTRVMTSPMPKIRSAIRSAWKISKSETFSPTPENLIGTPVICLILKAEPPRASPSNLEIITPVNDNKSLKALATLTASCPLIASTRSKISSGSTSFLI